MTQLALRIAVPLVAAAMALLPPSHAQAAPGDVDYAAVDAIEVGSLNLSITGIIEGAATPTTREYSFSNSTLHRDRCERYVLLAMAQPGKYRLTVLGPSGSHRCKLALRAP
jgi:hypothetical protein